MKVSIDCIQSLLKAAADFGVRSQRNSIKQIYGLGNDDPMSKNKADFSNSSMRMYNYAGVLRGE